jgi:hypothetical protein
MDLFQDAQPPAQAQQIRTQSDGRWYSPNRDFAYVGPMLIRQAFSTLTVPVDPASPYASLLNQLPEAEQHQIGDFAKSLATILVRAVTGATEVTKVIDGLRLEGDVGLQAPMQVQTAVLARIGELTLGCIFAAIQDITPDGGQPPTMRSIESMLEAAEQLAKKLQSQKA